MDRTLHRTARRRATAAAAVCSMLLGVAAVPHAAADDLKHKKHQVQQHIQGAQQNLDDSSAQLRAATAALQDAQGQLDQAQAHLATTQGELTAAQVLDRQMQTKLDAAVQRLAQARTDLADGRTKVGRQEKVLAQIAVQNYQDGDPALIGLSMVLTTQDPVELTSRLNSVHNVLDKESVTLDRLKASKILLTVQEEKVRQARDEVATQRQAAAENLRRKRRLEAQAEAAHQRVSNMVALRAEARHQARKAEQADLAELRNLQAERDRIAAILRRRAEAARRRAEAASAGAGASGGALHSNGFLDYPVNGPVTSPFGWRIHPIYGYRSLHDGVDFGVGCGTPIHAAASGTVLEEYYQTAWGNRLIIDHGYHRGVGLATIYNHMSGYAVRSGAHVRRGQVIGYVGTTGWSTGCHLHFTVLQNGTAVDPMNWL